ncbi:MAG: hypothetical protein K6G36_03245 [Candidatus Saccharibacteria bacterium]|nr:hypothetical protein [Candidatus Saccharibacteria bacterium]
MFNQKFACAIYVVPAISAYCLDYEKIERIVFEFEENNGRAQVTCDDEIDRTSFAFALGRALSEYEKVYGHGIRIYRQYSGIRYRYIQEIEHFMTFREEYRVNDGWDESRFPLMKVVHSPLAITMNTCHMVEWEHVSDFLDISCSIGLIREVDGEYAPLNMIVNGCRLRVRGPRDTAAEPGWGDEDNRPEGIVDAGKVVYLDDDTDEYEPDEYQGRPCARLSNLKNFFGETRS